MQRSILTRFVDLLLYGNFWIAACALALSFQTVYLLKEQVEWSFLSGFIFCSTLSLYALHRIVGLQKVQAFSDRGRYFVIQYYRLHIWVYAVLGAVGCGVLFFFLKPKTQLFLVIPALLSVAYVLPLFGRKRRLRDFHWIKIFLIAIVWGVVTVILPALEEFYLKSLPVWLMFLERCLFVFAITIPFDIRDLKIDAHTDVKTLPAHFGVRRSKTLAYIALLLVLILVFCSYWLGFYSVAVLVLLTISAISSGILIEYSDRAQHDYYFTGLVDGTMLIQPLLVGLSSVL